MLDLVRGGRDIGVDELEAACDITAIGKLARFEKSYILFDSILSTYRSIPNTQGHSTRRRILVNFGKFW